MKISIWWLLAVPVLIAGIAKSEGAHGVFWEFEAKRPEFQKSVADYIQSHCASMYLGPTKTPVMSDDLIQGRVTLWCRVDEHQK